MEILVGVILGLLVLAVAALILDQQRRAAPPRVAPGAPAGPSSAAPEAGHAPQPVPRPIGVMTPEGFFGTQVELAPAPPATDGSGAPDAIGEGTAGATAGDDAGEPAGEAAEASAEPWALADEDAETEFLVSQQEEGESPLPDVPTLIATIRQGAPIACREAIDHLVRHGAVALPSLEAALADPDPDVRIDVQKAIDRIRELD